MHSLRKCVTQKKGEFIFYMNAAEFHHSEARVEPLRRLLLIPLDQPKPALAVLLLKQKLIDYHTLHFVRELKFIDNTKGLIRDIGARREYVNGGSETVERYLKTIWKRQFLRRKTVDAMTGAERSTYVRWVAATAARVIAEEGKHTYEGRKDVLEMMRTATVETLENGIRYGHEAATGEPASNYTLSAFESANIQALATEVLALGEKKVTPEELRANLEAYIHWSPTTSPSTGPLRAA